MSWQEVFGSKAQATPGFIVVFILLVFLALSVIIYSLLSPVLGEFVDMGVDSSDDHDDGVTGFFIKITPFFIVLVFLGYAIFFIASRGGGYS